MNKERWLLIERTYHAALEREGEARSSFLNDTCAGDEELRSEVEELISHDHQGSSFIESPALAIAARELANDSNDQEQSEISNSPSAPQHVGPYKLLGPIGRGGMGEVHLALDSRLNRKVAIKLLPAAFTTDAERVRRFEQEARAASALNHPNILTIYEIGQHGSLHFIATEFIEGETLRQRMTSAHLTLQTVLEVGTQIASALAAAHDSGIVHRDIKPENIMLRPDGYVKVLDFGLAKLTEPQTITTDTEAPTIANVWSLPGMVVGTVTYMSPEQARGLEVDARTDIFSFGVVLYEVVAGRAPFEGATMNDVIAAILGKDPAPLARYWPEVPAELERIVGKALRKNTDERYQTVRDMQLDLKSLGKEIEIATKPEGFHASEASRGRQTAETVSARVTSSAEYIVTQLKRHRLGALITLAIFVFAAVASFFYFNRAPALTDKDTILLADFVNTTGDPVFDGTLKKGLAVQLEQSPFLNVFPELRVRQTLRMMGRSPDERVTGEIAREICERENIKMLISSSISPVGNNYVITLEAINGQSGEVSAREQVEAEGKEQVLRSLSQGATRLRERLGESLSSIRRFDKSLELATTSSLEALKAFTQAEEQALRGRFPEAIPSLNRAVELDPNFASAHGLLAVIYFNMKQPRLAADYAEKGYALRDRVSEYEKFRVVSYYYGFVTGEADKQIEVLEMQKQTYPRDFRAPAMLATVYDELRQSDKAVAEALEAVRLNPDFAAAYRNLGLAFIQLNRFAEGKEVYERALQQKLDLAGLHSGLYDIAFVSGDRASMQHQLDWASGKPDEHMALDWQTGVAAFAGERRLAQDFARRAIDLATRSGAKEEAARYAGEQALRAAVFGQFTSAKAAAGQSLALDRNQIPLTRAALALAQSGEPSQVQPLIAELAKAHPKDTLLNGVWLPTIRAAMELQLGNAGQAIELLQAARLYEAAADFWPPYLRGQAYLRLKSGREAAAEFQKILDHRGEAPLSALYPIAHLGLARASALAGDVTGSRKAYQDFLALWKDADADLPVLIEAKKEYERMK
jgi:serine/threonine protein kinase/tetratricopeptide (TPR) repeat protein